ncbi:MAG TPA: DUF885 family protein, partial [Salinibacter sp.]|nr:DUF885 family protein [Salinibacter sp.]
MRSTILSALFLALLCVAARPATAQPNAADQLHRLFEDAWEWRLQENPLFATAVGVHKYNDELPTVSVAAAERRLEQERAFLKRLRAIDRRALSEEDQLNYDLFERVRKRRIAEIKVRDFLIPITNRSGFHVSFPQLADRMPLNTVADYEDYIARLNAFERYARQHVSIMQTGLDEDYTLPKAVLGGVPATLKPQIVD